MFKIKDFIMVIIVSCWAVIILLAIYKIDDKISEIGDALTINSDNSYTFLENE
jgi:hypothetical protein